MRKNGTDMSSEGHPPPGDAITRGPGILRWTVALVALAGLLVAGIAALAARSHRAAPAVRPAGLTPRTDRRNLLNGRIVFASRSDSDGRYHIHVVNPDGTGETALTSGPADDKTPAWSPNRELIAFTRASQAPGSSGKTTHLYIMKADGTGLIQLTVGPGEAKDPSWSPEGTRIIFTAKDAAGKTRLLIATVDGTITGNKTQLQAAGHLTGDGVRYGENGALTLSSTFTVKIPELRLPDSQVSATTSATFVSVASLALTICPYRSISVNGVP